MWALFRSNPLQLSAYVTHTAHIVTHEHMAQLPARYELEHQCSSRKHQTLLPAPTATTRAPGTHSSYLIRMRHAMPTAVAALMTRPIDHFVDKLSCAAEDSIARSTITAREKRAATC